MFRFNRELAVVGIEWNPKRLYYIEAWRYPEIDSPTPWNIRNGFLEEFQVEEWLNQSGEFSPPTPPADVGTGSHGGIRLLACDYHLFPKTYVGMSQETFRLYEIGNYMLSLTYNMSSRWTTALLAGESITDMASTVFNMSPLSLTPLPPCTVVREYLMSSPTLWDHPLMLPSIVLSQHLRRLQHHCNRDLTPSVMGIEAQLGVTRVGRRNFEATSRSSSTLKSGPVARAQFEHLTVAINTQLTRVGFTARSPKWNYEASALLVRVMTEIAAFRPALRSEANEEILGVLDHNITLAKSLEDNVLGIQTRLELQLNVLYSFVAQTDNRLNARLAATAGRDSTSMKILAFITTVFLPGSYVAALFSMNMFNWDAGAADAESSDSGGSTISPQFWIYWAVAAPLTALTLTGWALWWSFEKHRYDEHLEGTGQITRAKTPPWWRRILESRNSLSPDLSPKVRGAASARNISSPGGNTRSVLHATPFPLCMETGRNTSDCMADMTAGLYGHSHPVIMESVDGAVKSIGMNLRSSTAAEARFAEAICDRFTSIDHIRFCNSGTEANLYALSVARQVTGRSKVIFFEGAYHGGILSFAHRIAPNNVDKDDWILGHYNDIDGVEQLITHNRDVAAAVLVEGMQGAGGCIPGSADFLHAIQTAAKANSIIFILDEVMTSRLAPGGLQSIMLHPDHDTPLAPDLTTLGKWIGGGLSIGAFGGRRDLMSVYDPRASNLHHSGTFNNNSLAINAGYKGMASKLAKGTEMVVTGVNAVMNIHFVSAGEQKAIARISDLEVKPDGVEEALRDLLWFYLEAEQLKGAIADFLEEFHELVSTRTPSQHPINASTFGAPCPQVYSYDNESIWSVLPYRIWNAEEMNEDCLFVNVWTPAEHRTERSTAGTGEVKGKAVMFFIPGGGFGEGAGSVGFYDGVNLASERDVLVVTFNYRLNIFGYPNAPGIDPAEQNVGLLDQRLAIEWVHQNIANFGGDPNRILLFGQSAGGASVDAYTYVYPENPLVSACVLESGTVSLFNNADTVHANWKRLSTAMGCGAGDGSLACMRKIPFPRILHAMSNGSYTFTPVVDDRTVFANYTARAISGGQARLPTLVGINAREFSAGFPLSQSTINETAVTEDLFGSFSCPAYEAVRTRLQQHIPIWRYVYHGNFTNLSPRPWLGAYHSGAWVALAQDPHTGLEEYGWPLFSFNAHLSTWRSVNLAVNNRPGAVLG
ncbi:hypothetical protein BDW75DRAFT_233667 [Aspergillus navahoensis]